MTFIQRYKFTLLMLLVFIVAFSAYPSKREQLGRTLYGNIKEMLSVIPPIFILMGLADVYVPRETVVRFMGEGSRARGIVLAILLGALAAGPLYAAFPIAAMMLLKGASFFNVMVFVGAWSTLKVPMFLFETASLGARFSVTRWLLNVPLLIAIAWLVDRSKSAEEKAEIIASLKANSSGYTPRLDASGKVE